MIKTNARQLLLVRQIHGSEAEVRYYVRGAAGWRLRGKGLAYIGKNGTGKTSEGDARTPLGELRALGAFGILPDPGCALPYRRIVPGTVACDEEGPLYNRIVQTREGDGINGERMWELHPEYDYGIETDYNAECIYPRGSAIFVHCKGAKSYTGGCIALDKPLMKKILITADKDLLIQVLK